MAKHASSKTIHNISAESYCHSIMETLNRQRQEGTLCDVTLVAEDTLFLAHKNVLAASSPYFYKLFTSDMAEKAQEIIKFELEQLALSRSVMADLLSYFYTGNLNILACQAQDLLIAGDYFLVPGLKNAAAEVLESMVNTDNCLVVQDLAERFSCDRLGRAATMFIENNFSVVRVTPSFLNLTFRQIQGLLSSDALVLSDESEVFEAVLTWISHKEEGRKMYFEQIFSKVRLYSLENEYLHFRVLGNEFVSKSTKCVNLIEKVFKSRLECSKQIETSSEVPRKCLQPPIDVVLTCGGMSPLKPNHSQLMRCFVPEEQTWHELAPMSARRNWHGVASCGDSFYVFGGEKDGLATSSCDKFDFVSNSWQEMSPMLREVTLPAVAELKGYIYVIGGVRNSRARLQIYRTKTNMWAYGTSLSVAREMTCVVAKDTYIYAIGGLQSDVGTYMNSVEKYDPGADSWGRVTGMLHPRAGAGAVALHNKIYVFGGEYEVRVAHTSCERYDIDLDEWSSISRMSVPRYFAGVAVVGDGFYVFGGVGGSNVDFEEKRVVEHYSVSDNRWTSELRMPWSERYFRCDVIQTRLHHLRGLPVVLN